MNGSAGNATASDTVARRWSFASAALGAVAWLVVPWLGAGSLRSFGSLEHVFLFMPLVAAPLGLVLLSTLMIDDRRSPPPLQWRAQLLQPIAAAMVLASFLVPKGLAAGALTGPWLVMTAMIAVGSAGRGPRGRGAHLSNLNLRAAHVFLPIGGVWLLLARLGAAPRDFSALTVFLATVHFHFSGFTLQLLVAATGRALGRGSSRLAAVHRWVAIGAVVGIPLIAAGNVIAAPPLKFVGVALVVLSVIGLALTSTGVALVARSSRVRTLLLFSAASVATAMVIAGVYGVGELTGRGWLGIRSMVTLHGLVNACGFTLFGLGAHLLAASDRGTVPTGTAAVPLSPAHHG